MFLVERIPLEEKRKRLIANLVLLDCCVCSSNGMCWRPITNLYFFWTATCTMFHEERYLVYFLWYSSKGFKEIIEKWKLRFFVYLSSYTFSGSTWNIRKLELVWLKEQRNIRKIIVVMQFATLCDFTNWRKVWCSNVKFKFLNLDMKIEFVSLEVI